MNPTIEALAQKHDCAIIEDREGDIALFQRIYVDDMQVIRPRPDPCDFYPPARWESMTDIEAVAAIC